MNSYLHTLAENYRDAINQEISDEIMSLSQENFIALYEPEKNWAIGPFVRRSDLTFAKNEQMPDPTGLSWTSTSIFNPSVIVDGEKIFLFYRASVKKESLGSRIGGAVYTPLNGWMENPRNPIIFPTEPNEILSVEDPKVYRFTNDETGQTEFVMFYNGAWTAEDELVEKYQKPFGNLGCDINYAFSTDLINWVKAGRVVPHEVSRLWAKGAVIPRQGDGSAVKIDGHYMMFISEGCGLKQVVGRSKNMRDWIFEYREYLPLPKTMGIEIYEIACAIVDGENLVMDFLYKDNNKRHAGGQALFKLSDPFTVLDYTTNATLCWGGMSKYGNTWIFAQGWDAPRDTEEIYFYEAPIR